MSTRPATTSHRAPSTITSATSATLLPGPSGLWILIGIGGRLAASPLPHHRAYGSVPRRFGRVSSQGRSRGGNPSEAKNAPGSAQHSAAVRVARHGPRLPRAVRNASLLFAPRLRNSR